MSARKTPILLRRGPISGRINAVFRYTKQNNNGIELFRAATDGQQDVTADFDALVLEMLFDPDSPRIIEQLDGAAIGADLTYEERKEISKFRARLIEITERHNNCLLYTSPSPRDRQKSRMPSSA